MNKNRLHKKFKENNRYSRRGPLNTKITTINTYNYLEHTKGNYVPSLVEQWCSKWLQRREISPQMASWIINRKAKPGVTFGNIKTHKKDNPLRLITSCCGTAIANLSAFTEFYLQPLARKQPSFIKDTTDLLNRI